jgi:phospholipase/lecithinase/hemolysin
MKKNYLKISVILLSVALSTFVDEALASEITRNAIFFGDSLSDVGNNHWIYGKGAPLTNPGSNHHAYLWVNYLLKNYNKVIYPSSKIGQRNNPYIDSVDYAYASANTSNDYLNADYPSATSVPPVNKKCTYPGLIKEKGYACVPGVLKQVDLYLFSLKKHSYAKPNPETVFFIWAGGNDLFYGYQSIAETFLGKMRALLYPPTVSALATRAVSNIILAKEKLMAAGVKENKIYILNMPDLSKTSGVLMAAKNMHQPLKYLFIRSIHKMAENYNLLLRQKLTNKNAVIDMNGLFKNMLQHPSDFNLTNTENNCKAAHALPACKGYLFYDIKHPTTLIHQEIAKNIQKILKAD